MKLHLGSLLLGLCGLAVAAGVTLIAYDQPVPWNAVAIGAPATLVVVGLLGMFSSRRRT
ncbi:hypothetical protein ACF3NT_09175 [Naumannella halotolerans]|uniref:Secreted protein with PEP-CTERM sorting signal n=1 Tax=Naumannella halotolerans TaxID=993414 RepID=A0A4R7JC42_9ACTN|nr:hypothetical protein [Naumannella halotolerans]TDT34203.1 hypothetical protein CLV29_1859 [Naumannella halotolerans]